MPEINYHPINGDRVNYLSLQTLGGEYMSVHRPAIIAWVHTEEIVDLCIIFQEGCIHKLRVQKGITPGEWSWRPDGIR